ncbi:hypothetical protein GIB67_015815 [Kingdonia uniflora]|uniref:Uncharacterized protein n=1 Tax=Kingdonia uniflora TaxID=39325 RepID=A0A7J7NUT3_9MAGN|nr:hypothetical protein GIB67_015815 [Kingdonia uniflora]
MCKIWRSIRIPLIYSDLGVALDLLRFVFDMLGNCALIWGFYQLCFGGFTARFQRVWYAFEYLIWRRVIIDSTAFRPSIGHLFVAFHVPNIQAPEGMVQNFSRPSLTLTCH